MCDIPVFVWPGHQQGLVLKGKIELVQVRSFWEIMLAANEIMMMMITFSIGKQDLVITSTYPPFFFTLQDTRLFTGMVSKGLSRSWVNIGLEPSVYNIWAFSFWRNGWTRIAIFQETCSRNIRRHDRQGCWGDFFCKTFLWRNLFRCKYDLVPSPWTNW